MKRLLLAMALLLLGVACGGGRDVDENRIAADPAAIVPAAADAMAGVESVRFDLERSGAPVYIDDVESIAVDAVTGSVVVPDNVEALVTVTIDGSVSTNLGAVATPGETLLSNPVTGVLEPLPPGYDLDPREFFDPVGAWQPLIAGLEDVTLVGTEDGERYHLRGVAPAERIEAVTAGLVRGQDVTVDLWVDPVTALVSAVEFDTVLDGATSSWSLELSGYNGAGLDGGGMPWQAIGIGAALTAGAALLAVAAWPSMTATTPPVNGSTATRARAGSPEAPHRSGSPEAPARGRASPRAILVVVAFSVFVAADDLTVVSTMLRPIIGDLGLVLPDGLDDAAWIVNVYLIAFVAVMPIAGRVSDVIGRRNTFIGAYVIFLIGTTLIPLMDSLGPFLVARVLTAIGGGAMVPVALAVVGDVYPPLSRARALGTLAAIETLGWVWGPMYGAILVRFLSWEWQFWLNIPLAVGGIAAVWWALSGIDQGRRASRVDWRGAVLLTTALVALNLALLGDAEIQSVTGFDELTGGGGFDFRWLYPVALVAGLLFVRHEQVAEDPLIDRAAFRGRSLRAALGVNFVVGAALVISMVDVPLFINAVEIDVEDSAVASGWVLSALTAAMALTSYIGGRLTARSGYRLPVVVGMGGAVLAYVLMGLTWETDTSYWVISVQLAVLGAGLGLVSAPTSAAVVDATEAGKRGAAAATLMVVRLMGLSVGLSLLTAWGLARFNALRADIELPALDDPGFEDAVVAAQGDLTAQAIAETFLAAAAITVIGLALAFAMRTRYEARAAPSGAEVVMTVPEGWGSEAPDSTNVLDPVAASDVNQPRPPDQVPPRFQRHSGPIIAALALAVFVAFVCIAVLFARLGDTQDELGQAREDLSRVEAGAALYSSQVTGIQEQLSELEPTISSGLEEAVSGLEEFAASTIEFTVNIDEQVRIDTEVVLDRDLQIPINETLPIRESFDTRIEVDTPLGFTVPLDVTVPVDIEVPVVLDLDVPVNETIPVNTTVPVKIDVPIAIEVADTELAELASALAAGLRSLQDVLDGLSG